MPANAVGQIASLATGKTPSRASSLLKMDCNACRESAADARPVGVSLLANAVGQIASLATEKTLSRASALLQWIWVNPRIHCSNLLQMDVGKCPGVAADARPVGARLPANAVGQVASMMADDAPSRASSLPQWIPWHPPPDLRQHTDLDAPGGWRLRTPDHEKTRRSGFISNGRLNETSCLPLS